MWHIKHRCHDGDGPRVTRHREETLRVVDQVEEGETLRLLFLEWSLRLGGGLVAR